MIWPGGCKTLKPVAENKSDSATVNSLTETPQVTSAVNFSDQSTWLLGYIEPRRLAQPPYSQWYLPGFDGYQCNGETLMNLAALKTPDISIKIVLGTWCPDSRREVPRFMRILNDWNFPLLKVQMIGVDDSRQSPVTEFGTLDIQRVPTFIIYKNNIEAGRIIENPLTSLEQDLVNILTSKVP